MALLWGTAVGLLTWAEMAGPGTAPQLAGGAMEGKEVRFGEAASALFAASTTGTSTGAVNAAHDSLTAPGGGVALFNMMLGEIAPGGVGSGLYGMMMLAVVTVFLAGLMVAAAPQARGRPVAPPAPAHHIGARLHPGTVTAAHPGGGGRSTACRSHRLISHRRPGPTRAAVRTEVDDQPLLDHDLLKGHLCPGVV